VKIEQSRWSVEQGWESALGGLREAQLVLLFGDSAACARQECFADVVAAYPAAEIVGCSTAGEIAGTEVTDGSLVATALAFDSDSSRVECLRAPVARAAESFEVGRDLARALDHEGLVHVLVFSEGLEVNGSDLVRGLAGHLPENVTVTGGLSADGADFAATWVIWRGVPERRIVVAVGLYGPRLRVGFGSLGGWDPFGPERRITRSSGNVLYELDGRSALELYKLYLGEHAAGLPATGLLFPLSLRNGEQTDGVVRTLLAVDEAAQSMTFAGDVPEGASVRLMTANFDRLIDGAVGAARTSVEPLGPGRADLALLISCVGRKMLLGQRIEEEVEGVRDVLGAETRLAGFYSYGEISPFTRGARCELHNQTMTITTLSERSAE
jgi:hypothetical protein